jgi:hypothetical protein
MLQLPIPPCSVPCTLHKQKSETDGKITEEAHDLIYLGSTILDLKKHMDMNLKDSKINYVIKRYFDTQISIHCFKITYKHVASRKALNYGKEIWFLNKKTRSSTKAFLRLLKDSLR